VNGIEAMITPAPALAAAIPRQSWLDFLRAELASAPGRLNATVRIVVATSIVLVTSMALEVPQVELSLLVVLFLTALGPGAASQNTVAVVIASITTVVVLTFAMALSLLILKFTIDYPPLRVTAMALAVLLGMFAFRVFALPAAGFVVALIVLETLANDSLFSTAEPIVRGMLWTWVAIAYPAAVAVAVNLLLLPADPEPLLRRESAERLRAVARALTAPPGSEEARASAASLASFFRQGSAPLLKLVKLAEMQDSTVKPLRDERTAKVALLTRLVEEAALLLNLAVEPTPEQRTRLDNAALACKQLAAAIFSYAGALPVPPPPTPPDSAAPSALAAVLFEIDRLVHEFPLAERPDIDKPDHRVGLFVPDALTNPVYVRFALKATLAAMFCYVAYNALDWPGISTCMTTCVVVALGSTGATIHKSTLRLVGCAIAGVLALATIVFVEPHMTSITPLVLLVAAVTAPAAWIAMGSQRTAYVGLQIAFTFYLVVLQSFDPGTNVTEFRDRFVGVAFGVVVMALVFTCVWPERAGTGMVRSLAASLRRMAQLARGGGDLRAARAAAWQSLAEADQFAEVSGFEAGPLASQDTERDKSVRGLIDPARQVLLVQTALVQQRATGDALAMDARARAARSAFASAVAEALSATATRLETAAPLRPVELRTPLAAMRAASRASGAATVREGEFALCDALVDRVEALQRAGAIV
jgi:multidrug resistance protein MdtO